MTSSVHAVGVESIKMEPRMARMLESAGVWILMQQASTLDAYLPGRHAISPSVSVELMAGMVLLLIGFLILPAILALLCFCAYVKIQSRCSKGKIVKSAVSKRFQAEYDEQQERLLHI